MATASRLRTPVLLAVARRAAFERAVLHDDGPEAIAIGASTCHPVPPVENARVNTVSESTVLTVNLGAPV